MKKSGTVVGQVRRKTVVPFICYMLVSVLLLPPIAMESYGKSLEHYGGLSMGRVLHFFKRGNERILAILQTAFSLNYWENMYIKAEAQRRELEFQIADLQRKAEETKQLRQILSLGNGIGWQHVHAEIIVRSGSTLQDSLAIDVGLEQGIYRDAPVIGFVHGKYGLIGKVQTVRQKQSTVVSLLNRYYQLGVTAMLQNSRFQGILSGTGRLYRLDFIDRQALNKIQSGDLVISVGSKESLYPRGIPIGYVEQVKELEHKASLSLVVKPMVELSQVEYVAVLLEDDLSEYLEDRVENQKVTNGEAVNTQIKAQTSSQVTQEINRQEFRGSRRASDQEQLDKRGSGLAAVNQGRALGGQQPEVTSNLGGN